MNSKKYFQSRIFYFSGTGNAFQVAKWMQLAGNESEVETNLVNIGTIENRLQPTVEKEELVGIIAPTHGFNFPPIVLNFILRFPRAKSNSIFIINTRAGMKAGRFFLPGLSGITQFLAAVILKCKGYKIAAMYPVDLPSNWISLHPGLKKTVVESIYSRQQKKLTVLGQNIFNGKKNYRACFDIVQDVLISPIAIGYYFIGRFLIAKTFVADSSCNNCNLCIKQCPVKAIKNVAGQPFWTYRCESCMQCMNVCPQRSIQTAHGFFALALFLAGLIVGYRITDTFSIDNLVIESIPPFLNYLLEMVLKAAVYFLVIVVLYFLMHKLMRFRWFERLIYFTSFTHFKFWRRYKSPKVE